MLLQGVFWADFWIYISFPKESFFGAEKKPRDFDSIPGCFGGGTLEAGRREQETFSLVQPKAQAPDTTPEPLADESPGSMKMEKELFGVRMRTWRLDHQGVKCFFLSTYIAILKYCI